MNAFIYIISFYIIITEFILKICHNKMSKNRFLYKTCKNIVNTIKTFSNIILKNQKKKAPKKSDFVILSFMKDLKR